MRKLILAVFIALTQPLHAQSYAPRDVAGWPVAPMGDLGGSCFITTTYEGDGETSLSLAMNPKGEPTLIVSNENWTIEPGQEMEIDYFLSFGMYEKHPSFGTVDRGFGAKFEKSFIEYFAKSNFIRIEKEGSLIDSLDLSGSAAAVIELRRCVKKVQEGADIINNERRKLNQIPTNPFNQ